MENILSTQSDILKIIEHPPSPSHSQGRRISSKKGSYFASPKFYSVLCVCEPSATCLTSFRVFFNSTALKRFGISL